MPSACMAGARRDLTARSSLASRNCWLRPQGLGVGAQQHGPLPLLVSPEQRAVATAHPARPGPQRSAARVLAEHGPLEALGRAVHPGLRYLSLPGFQVRQGGAGFGRARSRTGGQRSMSGPTCLGFSLGLLPMVVEEAMCVGRARPGRRVAMLTLTSVLACMRNLCLQGH